MFPVTQTQAQIDQLRAKLAATEAPENNGGGVLFLRFAAKGDGQWTAGSSNELIDTPVVFNPLSARHGWLAWSEGRPYKHFVPFSDPLPAQPAPIGDNEYRPALALDFAMADGTMLSFESNNKGTLTAWPDLWTPCHARLRTDTPYFCPRVKLGSRLGKKSQYPGRTYFPTFTIVGWCDLSGKPAPDSAAESRPARVEDRRRPYDEEIPF